VGRRSASWRFFSDRVRDLPPSNILSSTFKTLDSCARFSIDHGSQEIIAGWTYPRRNTCIFASPTGASLGEHGLAPLQHRFLSAHEQRFPCRSSCGRQASCPIIATCFRALLVITASTTTREASGTRFPLQLWTGKEVSHPNPYLFHHSTILFTTSVITSHWPPEDAVNPLRTSSSVRGTHH